MVTWIRSRRVSGEITVKVFEDGKEIDFLSFDTMGEWLEYKEKKGW